MPLQALTNPKWTNMLRIKNNSDKTIEAEDIVFPAYKKTRIYIKSIMQLINTINSKTKEDVCFFVTGVFIPVWIDQYKNLLSDILGLNELKTNAGLYPLWGNTL